ncbi:cupin domain-containing protein [Pinibacter aurantiacus]|uniref:Cupin domain-containing protein n=1 Tax=Pinibacter aurantiacus TaxID=2851599 RepID=A0A9E2W965_9BACT|nr:cupin domain-containing protein [Pinibacter aurantiacus]MBV4359237.1 cupin domain-containing protein [Pinibacter aurantiacus]
MQLRVFQNPKFKDKVTVLKEAHETNNQYLLLEVELAPEGGNSLHYHTSFSEEFIPVEGVLGVGIDDKEYKLLPGETSTVPVNKLHRFFNPTSNDIKFHVKISPASQGFLQSLQISYGLAEDGLTNKSGIPKKLDHLALLLDLSDTRLPGFLKLITPLLLHRAKKARRKGVYDELVRKYCRN